MQAPRVAYFPDSFHEVNGVAHTSRNFFAYAQRHGLPLLCVRAAGAVPLPDVETGLQTTLELPRSAASVGMEQDLAFDPLFWRHADRIEDELHRFQPDLIHMTGPSELGMFAAYFAWKLDLPLAASWHTNVHEYAARRMNWLTDRVPGGSNLARAIESGSLQATTSFYRLAQVLFAPNDELCRMLSAATDRPCHLMQRGVDIEMFSPSHRRPRPDATSGDPFVLGYVGRLSVEKNVALLTRIARELEATGVKSRFLIIGQGAEEQTLRRDLPQAQFTGVLRGLALSRAYAEMDLLVFPSHTDTFGNVVLEALASGVPAIVTPDGGPRFIVRDRQSGEPETGVICGDEGFAGAIRSILLDPARFEAMRVAARAYARRCSWDAVFERVYAGYLPVLERAGRVRECRTGITTDSNPG